MQIAAFFPSFIYIQNFETFEVLGVRNMVFYLVDNPLTFTLKVAVLDLKYIKRVTSSERSEIRVFLNIAMFVVKLTDSILENKSVNEIFLYNQCPDTGF